MEFELKDALKKYGQMRARRRIAVSLITIGGFGAPWFFDLNRTESLICFLGAALFACVSKLEFRLKTMQIRLADVDDKLDVLSGNEPDGNVIAELNDW